LPNDLSFLDDDFGTKQAKDIDLQGDKNKIYKQAQQYLDSEQAVQEEHHI
jgi:hypothetical protein